MPVLLAFDDTDAPSGGCTTRLVFDVLAALPGVAPRGLPRLVRLNPNVPWKTRGNGAVCIPLASMEGARAVAGEWHGHDLFICPEAPAPALSPDEVLEAVRPVVEQQARKGASPAVAVFPEAPPEAAYWAAVQDVVEPSSARRLADASGAAWAAGDGRGLVGALAAAAWPGPPSSFELIAYRDPAHVGTPRRIDPAPLRSLDDAGTTFHGFDGDRMVCAPATPCPVLVGLRGKDPDTLAFAATRALKGAALEPIAAWALWATNQASGDHVVRVSTLAEAGPHQTVRVVVRVTARPERRRGAHVHAPVTDAAGRAATLVAFEPTGAFRDVVEALRPGDHVQATGAWGDGVVRLERLDLLERAVETRKAANPACCDRPMKSMGTGAGYRCPACGAKAPPEAAVHEEVPRAIALGAHEVPVAARRHLHRPLAFGDA